MAHAVKKQIRYTKAPRAKNVKPGGHTLVSEALIKKSASNLTPKMHVKRGDVVMLLSGSKKNGRGQTGKVLNVYPRLGKIVVEGINMITCATRQRAPMGQSGLIKKEGPIFASRVMLYCTACKKPTRIKHKLDGEKKARICQHCKEAIDA